MVKKLWPLPRVSLIPFFLITFPPMRSSLSTLALAMRKASTSFLQLLCPLRVCPFTLLTKRAFPNFDAHSQVNVISIGDLVLFRRLNFSWGLFRLSGSRIICSSLLGILFPPLNVNVVISRVKTLIVCWESVILRHNYGVLLPHILPTMTPSKCGFLKIF